ncbi:hypothetical protein Plhal710r2_c014g0065141 [Plasmopara halstedii]
MLIKSRPTPLTGVTTSNYFDVLSTIEVEFGCCPATIDKTTNLQLLPDRLAAADAKVDVLHKVLRTTNNPETLTFMSSVKALMAFNTVLLGQMRESSPSHTEIAQLHMINRILSATDPTATNTFARKWAKYVDTKVPKTPDDVIQCLASWWDNSNTAIKTRATRALSLFEMMLVCTAPMTFDKDYWLQRLTGWSVP